MAPHARTHTHTHTHTNTSSSTAIINQQTHHTTTMHEQATKTSKQTDTLTHSPQCFLGGCRWGCGCAHTHWAWVGREGCAQIVCLMDCAVLHTLRSGSSLSKRRPPAYCRDRASAQRLCLKQLHKGPWFGTPAFTPSTYHTQPVSQ